ncbi:MlaD family protein [Mycobacteroides chelonae]|uniref:Mammalian cell entry protein n=1 Tax=Mycobacteroides chelonae TaxID=1774 RepID=A0AB73LSM3_MYCCH|nr:MlaD family protein [Mycobacteroides chelonae]SKL40224.1 Putative Mce family protein [Mycobacteroides abscessus subsp. bolletii]AYM44094.1 MCE family protein [[Mycobacterium] chelonae subsp. gwanakae]MBF9318356.1 MCE family protein [Mycobacteroides chelonae]MBF9329611.1 MCE family protein [Mycobacteroides chelonae]MBF9423922.1 MCE family protein [Mycobacteroides chelonae]
MIGLRRLAGSVVAVAVLLTSGCSTNGLASLPLPAPGMSGGSYGLKAIFTNILNLPSRAKVKLGGADIGEVDSMSTTNYTAVVTMRIRSDVEIPKGTTVELRTATPLGDVFVALKPPRPADPNAPLLRDGDTFGLESTTAAATVEAVLSSAAIIVNGGAVRNLTGTVNGLGRATGPNGAAFGDLIGKSNRLLGTLNARSSQLDSALRDTAELAAELDTRHQTIAELLTAAAPATDALSVNATHIADLADQVGAVTKQLSKFPSIAGTDTSGRSVIADFNTLSRSFNDIAVSPDTSLAALNRLMPPIVKIMAGSGFAARMSIDKIALGSIPDIGYQGDPGLHGPKRYDWAKLVGSFKYTLWRLQERVVGKGPDAPAILVRPSPTEPGVIEPIPGAVPVPQGPPR